MELALSRALSLSQDGAHVCEYVMFTDASHLYASDFLQRLAPSFHSGTELVGWDFVTSQAEGGVGKVVSFSDAQVQALVSSIGLSTTPFAKGVRYQSVEVALQKGGFVELGALFMSASLLSDSHASFLNLDVSTANEEARLEWHFVADLIDSGASFSATHELLTIHI